MPHLPDDHVVDAREPVLVGVDAGATKSVAIAVTPARVRVGRATGAGANPKRHGLDAAADTIAALAREAAGFREGGRAAAEATDDRPSATAPDHGPAAGAPVDVAPTGPDPALVFVAGAGIDRPVHARVLEEALHARLSGARVLVANDTLAVLRAGTPDGVGLAIPISTGGNVIGRGPDGRVTDRGHGIFGGGYALGALAARAARRGAALDDLLARAVGEADLRWTGRRPAPDAALLGAAVAEAAERGDRLALRMVDRWCGRVTRAVREEIERLGLPDAATVITYGGLGEAVPWLAGRIRAAVLASVPGARIVGLEKEPAEGAADLAVDAWSGVAVAWDFEPRR
jgi:N-acetylglucosamine kinase-like BadF-type ATPase